MLSRVASTTWNPLHLPDVAAWIDATDSNTVFRTAGMAALSTPDGAAGAGDIGRILNKVGGLSEVRDPQATASFPQYKSSIFGSLPGALVQQSGQPLVGNITHAGNEMSVALVCKFRIVHAGGLLDWRSIFEAANGTGANAGEDDSALGRLQINGPEDNAVVYYDGDSGDPGVCYPSAITTSTVLYVLQRNHASKAVKLWTNGGTPLSDGYGVGAALNVTKFSLLGSVGGSATECYLGEAILGTRCWSNADLNKLRTYVNTKYGASVTAFSGGFS